MSKATLDGKSISLEDACREAARILSGATFPLVAGLGADVAGARAAILLAEQLRGAFDHLASKEILADLDVLRSFSMFTTTPNEARVRADALLFVGSGLSQLWPAMLERLAPGQPPRHHGKLGVRKRRSEAVVACGKRRRQGAGKERRFDRPVPASHAEQRPGQDQGQHLRQQQQHHTFNHKPSVVKS